MALAAKRVLLLSRYDRKGASSRLRFLDLLPDLERHGVRVTASPFFDDAYLERLYAGEKAGLGALARFYLRRARVLLGARRFDAVWLEKEAFPWLPAWIERLFLRGCPYVVDFDDAWHLRYGRHRLAPVRALLERKLERVVAGAAATVVGNDFLAEWARAAGAGRVVRIPTTLDPGRYHPAARPPAATAPLVVGWVGSPSSMEHLRTIAPVLGEMAAAGEIALTVVGAVAERLQDCPATYLDWTEAGEADTIAGFDVGIMPLTDSLWSRGKCAYKLLQYMAAGLPVVASPVGMNCEVVVDGETGFLPSDAEGWRQALRRLRADPALRAAMGRKNRARVEERYSRQAVAPRLAECFRAVCGG